MGKLQPNKRKYSKNGKRFYTSRDMAIFKHDEAVLNSKAKRGEIELKNNHNVVDCGCGIEGCFISITRDSKPKKTMVEVKKK